MLYLISACFDVKLCICLQHWALFNQICFSQYPRISRVVGVKGGTALELSNPQVAPGIIPKADIAIGCTEFH